MNKVEIIKVELAGNYLSKLNKAQQEVENVINRYNDHKYKVVSVTPLTGSYSEDGTYRYNGYGYSFTIGIMIVFEKIID
jgi:hypothetical protein